MIVLDSSPIIYLGKLGLLEKLKEIEDVLVTNSVFKEVVQKPQDFQETEYIRKCIIGNLRDPQKNHFENINGLSKADSESLSLAKELGCPIILDEKKGRQTAKLYSIEAHGTVYILFKLLENKIISKQDFKDSLDKIMVFGFYLSGKTYSEIIRIL